MIVFDVTNKMSFQNVHRYVDQIKDGEDNDQQIMLIGNKIDEGDKRVVDSSVAEDYALKHGMMYLELSAKDFDRVAFDAKLEEIVKKSIHSINQ